MQGAVLGTPCAYYPRPPPGHSCGAPCEFLYHYAHIYKIRNLTYMNIFPQRIRSSELQCPRMPFICVTSPLPNNPKTPPADTILTHTQAQMLTHINPSLSSLGLIRFQFSVCGFPKVILASHYILKTLFFVPRTNTLSTPFPDLSCNLV